MDAGRYNDEIIKLWQTHYGDNYAGRSPLLYKELEEHCILFIGINPGYDHPSLKKCLIGTEFGGLDLDEVHNFANISIYTNEIIGIQEEAKKNLPYFKKFKEIAKYVGLPWEHIDLFYKRETNQNSIKEEYFIKDKLIEFAKDQFKLSMDIAGVLRPRVIVVANALASDIINQQIKSIEFNESYGMHKIIIGGNSYPIFFSGMLTGQRALDKGSYKRLSWHIKFVSDKYN